MADTAFLKTLMTTRNHVIGVAWGAIKARWASQAIDDAMTAYLPPVGSIQAWYDFNATLTVPTGWHLCDGSTVSDPDSPINGKALPNLNTAGTDPIFLGGYTSTGATPTLVNSNLPTHTHGAGTLTSTPTAKVQLTSGGAIIGFLNTAVLTNSATTSTSNSPINATAVTGSTDVPSIGAGTSNYPHHMKVKFIIRVK